MVIGLLSKAIGVANDFVGADTQYKYDNLSSLRKRPRINSENNNEFFIYY